MTAFNNKLLIESFFNNIEEDSGFVLFNYEHRRENYRYVIDQIFSRNDLGIDLERVLIEWFLDSGAYRISYLDQGLWCRYTGNLSDRLKTYGEVSFFLSDTLRNGYLMGGEYSLEDTVVVLESYRDKAGDLFLLFFLENTSIAGSWQWGLRELINLNNGNRINLLKIGYQLNEQLTPSLSLISAYRGVGEAKIANLPWKRELALGLEMKF